jgi:hypothetical protein
MQSFRRIAVGTPSLYGHHPQSQKSCFGPVWALTQIKIGERFLRSFSPLSSLFEITTKNNNALLFCKHNNEITMTVQPQIKPPLIRSDSCSLAEIKKSLAMPKDAEVLEQINSMPRQIRQRRRIAFDEQVMVRTIEHINDKDPQEIEKTWYKKAEYQMMRAAFAVTVRKIINSQYKGDCEHHCARGLEFRSPGGAQRRRMNKLNGLVAVLDEQERQLADDDENEEALACVYVHANYMSRHEGSQRGELDGEEALRVHKGKESLTTLMYKRNCAVESAKDTKEHVGKRIGNIFKRKEKRGETRARSPLSRQ